MLLQPSALTLHLSALIPHPSIAFRDILIIITIIIIMIVIIISILHKNNKCHGSVTLVISYTSSSSSLLPSSSSLSPSSFRCQIGVTNPCRLLFLIHPHYHHCTILHRITSDTNPWRVLFLIHPRHHHYHHHPS